MITIPQGTNIPTDQGITKTAKIGPKNVKDVPPTANTGLHIVKDDPQTAKDGPKNVEDVPPIANHGPKNAKDVPPIAKRGPKSDKEDPPIAKIGTRSTQMVLITTNTGITKVGPDKIEVGPDKGLDHPTNKGQDHPAGKDPKDSHPIRPQVPQVVNLGPQSAGIVVKKGISIGIALSRKVIVPFDRGLKGKQ